MASSFKFNDRAIEQLVEQKVAEVAGQYEQLLDRLRLNLQGQTVATIKPVLQAEWQRIAGGSITEPELTQYAQAIADGQKIAVRVKR